MALLMSTEIGTIQREYILEDYPNFPIFYYLLLFYRNICSMLDVSQVLVFHVKPHY